MAYSIHSHISYIIEDNSKRSIRKKKRIRKRSYVEEIEWADFFVVVVVVCLFFLIKIFGNIQLSFMCFQNNSNKRYCLHSM